MGTFLSIACQPEVGPFNPFHVICQVQYFHSMAPKLHFDDSNVFVVREKKQLSRNRAMPWTNINENKAQKA